MSRNDKTKGSLTGLSTNSKRNYNRAGPRSIYSAALKVESGDSLILILDNVYSGENGFSLLFKYYDIKTITGTVKDKNSEKPLAAEVYWEDISTGEVLASAKSNIKTGAYKMDIAKQKPKSNYNISFYAKGYFLQKKQY